MKQFILTGVILLSSALTGEAIAACSTGGGWSQVTNLVSTLTNSNQPLGMTACSSVGRGTQEEHHSNLELWDYKCGDTGTAAVPGTACAKPDVDRRRQIGTWSVANDGGTSATVTYSYTAFGSSTAGPYTVYTDGALYDFCDASNASTGIFTLSATTSGSRVCPGP